MASTLLPTPLVLLFTATALTIITQFILNHGVPNPSAQFIACIKYTGPLLTAFIVRGLRSRSKQDASKSSISAPSKRYLLIVGLMDIVAYSLLSHAFAACGSAFTLTIFSAAGQLCTAFTAIVVQRKKLTWVQYCAVAMVLLGLTVRASPWLLPSNSSENALSPSETTGVACMLISAVIYAVEGAIYEKVLQMEGPNINHAEAGKIYTSVGAVALLMYQVVYTLPRWSMLVVKPYVNGSSSLLYIIGLYLIHGVCFTFHNQVNSKTIQDYGLLAVSIVNALRSALMAGVSHVLFCSPSKPLQCLSITSGASAVIVTVGALAWAMGGRQAKKSQTKTE